MKKLFIVLAVASLGFVACNNDADTAEAARLDSLAKAKTQDSINAVAKATEDSINAVKMATPDTMGLKKDSIK